MMLKKIFLGLLTVIVLILVFHSFIIGTIVKPQAEKQISKMLGADVQIGVLSFRLWPGSAAIYGLKIKNPSGFSDQNLLDLGSAAISLDVPGLLKQFTSVHAGPKTIVVDHIKIKGFKFLFERLNQGDKPLSNVEKLAENINAKQPAPQTETAPSEQPAQKPSESKQEDVRLELKQFSFKDGRVTVKDATVGKGFEYTVDAINIDFGPIHFPAKPAAELVESITVSAELGESGSLDFQGRSNFMAGPNLDAQLSVSGVAISDFNAFVSDQPFKLAAGDFNLKSVIKILDSHLQSSHQLQLNSMKLASNQESSVLMDLPMQTLTAALNRMPSLDVPFEVNGDLQNPQFKLTRAIRAAIGIAIQKVLAGGLGDLKGLADSLQGQALGIAGDSTEKVAGEATKLVQGIAGEGTETLDAGIKKLSGFLSKVKSE